MSILIVDDIPANQKVAQSILAKQGYCTHLASNGCEALDILKREGIDVILMDVQMPLMDGLETTAVVRAFPDGRVANVPIIAMTAQTQPADRLRCLSAGMNHYIAKPVHAEELVALIERATHTIRGSSMSVPPASNLPGAGLESAVAPGPIDIAAAMRRIGNDRGLLRDLAVFFIEDVPPLIAQLQTSIPSGEAYEVERAAHSIKGLAANFNAQGVQACAQRLEDAGRAAKLDGALDLLAQLLPEVDIVVSALHKEVFDIPA